MNLSHTERDKYERIWEDEEKYRKANHSLDFWHNHLLQFPQKFNSVLDIGCGTGRFYHYMILLHAKDAWGVDIAANCLDDAVQVVAGSRFIRANLWEWKPERTWDLGVCCDVMEHIPTEMVDIVLRTILGCCRVVMFRIATHESCWQGEDLHLTKKDQDWWEARIKNAALCDVTLLPDTSKHVNHCFRVDIL